MTNANIRIEFASEHNTDIINLHIKYAHHTSRSPSQQDYCLYNTINLQTESKYRWHGELLLTNHSIQEKAFQLVFEKSINRQPL